MRCERTRRRAAMRTPPRSRRPVGPSDPSKRAVAKMRTRSLPRFDHGTRACKQHCTHRGRPEGGPRPNLQGGAAMQRGYAGGLQPVLPAWGIGSIGLLEFAINARATAWQRRRGIMRRLPTTKPAFRHAGCIRKLSAKQFVASPEFVGRPQLVGGVQRSRVASISSSVPENAEGAAETIPTDRIVLGTCFQGRRERFAYSDRADAGTRVETCRPRSSIGHGRQSPPSTGHPPAPRRPP